MDLYILNENLQAVGIVDDYTSLIWAKRYNGIGDCEIYVQATEENIRLLRRGYFIERSDDDMICRIKKIELETDAENGDYLIVTGYDCKDILNQRIIWNQLIFKGKVIDYITRMVRDAFNMEQLEQDPPVRTQRQIRNFHIADRERAMKDEIDEQVEHDNLGEKVKALCQTYEYGYKVTRDGGELLLDVYEGGDKSDRVIFSQGYDNLVSTKYVEDATNVGNVALVGGVGLGNEQTNATINHTPGIDRYEVYIDASSTADTTTYADLKKVYPLRSQGGVGYLEAVSPTYIVYMVDYLDVMLMDNVQFQTLLSVYDTGSICYKKDDGTYQYIEKDGKTYDELRESYPDETLLYQIYTVQLANLLTARLDGQTIIPPADADSVTLAKLLYGSYLLCKGYEEIATRGVKTSFDGTIEPSSTFVYKTDYDLGDLVMVENEYGIRAKARITEIMETFDEDGYTIEPKFEFKEVN